MKNKNEPQAKEELRPSTESFATERDSAIASLVDMARRRGLHASQLEAEQAWNGVTPKIGQHRIAAAWARLFQGHKVEVTRAALLSKSQLPAWIISNHCIGVVTAISATDAELDIEWFGRRGDGDFQSALVMVPVHSADENTKSFVPQKQRGVATQAITVALKAHRKLFVQAALATVCINLIAVLSSLFAMQVYDRVVPNFAYSTLFFLAAGVGLAYVLDVLFKFARLGILEASKHQLDEVLSLYIFERLLALKIDRRPQRVGSLVAQVRDYESVKSFFSSTTLFALADLPFIFVFIGIIYLIGGVIAVVPAAFVVVCLLIGLIAYPPMAKRQRENNDAFVRKQGLLFEAVSGAEVIKSSGGEAKFGDAWLSATRETSDRNESLSRVVSSAQYATSFFQQISFVAVLCAGVFVIERGEMTMGGLIACSILGGRTLSYIANISGVLLNWHHARYALQVLNELLSCDSDNSPDRQANTKSVGLDLALRQVVYQYQGQQMPQLSVEELMIPAGSRVAILGKNGSGKTTLLKLAASIYTPSAGKVTLSGLDVEHCRPSWLREVVGYLPQEPRLFSGTLLDNLTLGMSMPSEKDVWEALDAVGLAQTVKRHGEGLLLPIQEGGSGLSGGQRQLVSMARLLLQKPKIWLLDEPSASLDSETEARVKSVIQSLPKLVTVVFTTHRASWLELAQRVLIVENGQIRADAPADRVKATSRAAAGKLQNGAGGVSNA